jgi:hypothetical protein
MATEQLPAAQYIVGGQLTLTGWILPQNSYGIVEDAETKTLASGAFKCDITYSRRQTLKVTLEALTGATPSTYSKGGTIASGVFADSAGAATAWKIRDVQFSQSRNVTIVELDLIGLADLLA